MWLLEIRMWRLCLETTVCRHGVSIEVVNWRHPGLVVGVYHLAHSCHFR